MLEKLQTVKTNAPPPPKYWCSLRAHALVLAPFFDWSIFSVVIVDIILIIIKLSVGNNVAVLYFRNLNCAIVGVYTGEAILKVLGHME